MDDFASLMESEGIEKGDILIVENEDGSESKVKYLLRGKFVVKCQDVETNMVRRYNASNLEEIDGESILIGKKDL